MHYLIGIITAVMVLFPASDSGGKSLYQLWMDAYEKYLYQQMYDNFEREKRERNAEICQNPAESEVSIEQKASEETTEQFRIVADGTGTTGQGSAEKEPTVGMVTAPEMESQTESRTEDGRMDENGAPAEVVREVTPLYSVDGYIPDEGIQTYLYQRLCEHGIGYFMPYAVCLIAQESTWNPMAENRNGLDKGLLQYRISYWPTLEWWNPYAEIDVFVQQMANRATAGRTVSEMISAHNQSDYGPYCQEYVSIVMSHEAGLVRIR